MIAVGDARQDWGILQHVEGKQIPHHGLLQTETDLGLTAEGGHFLSRSYLRRAENIRLIREFKQYVKLRGVLRLKCIG